MPFSLRAKHVQFKISLFRGLKFQFVQFRDFPTSRSNYFFFRAC